MFSVDLLRSEVFQLTDLLASAMTREREKREVREGKRDEGSLGGMESTRDDGETEGEEDSLKEIKPSKRMITVMGKSRYTVLLQGCLIFSTYGIKNVLDKGLLGCCSVSHSVGLTFCHSLS